MMIIKQKNIRKQIQTESARFPFYSLQANTETAKNGING
jgi:hypothetical protein